jgi:hypothetical protein
MEMIVVPVPRANFIEPSTISFFIFAHLNFSPGKDKNPSDTRITGGSFKHIVMLFGPATVDKSTSGFAHGNRGQTFALDGRQVQSIGRQHPNIRIKPNLVTGMTR